MYLLPKYFRINQVDGSEVGQYKCVAENEAGSATAVANLIVQVFSSLMYIKYRTGTDANNKTTIVTHRKPMINLQLVVSQFFRSVLPSLLIHLDPFS